MTPFVSGVGNMIRGRNEISSNVYGTTVWDSLYTLNIWNEFVTKWRCGRCGLWVTEDIAKVCKKCGGMN